jgi:hypothetical protein
MQGRIFERMWEWLIASDPTGHSLGYEG